MRNYFHLKSGDMVEVVDGDRVLRTSKIFRLTRQQMIVEGRAYYRKNGGALHRNSTLSVRPLLSGSERDEVLARFDAKMGEVGK